MSVCVCGSGGGGTGYLLVLPRGSLEENTSNACRSEGAAPGDSLFKEAVL